MEYQLFTVIITWYITPQITRLGKDQNSKFEAWYLLSAYHVHAIVSRDCLYKLNGLSTQLHAGLPVPFFQLPTSPFPEDPPNGAVP